MTKQGMIAVAAVALVCVFGCTKNGTETTQEPASAGETVPPPTDEPSEATSLTNAECEAKGGVVVGDIGDGAIHRPDYLCESGERPFGTIRAEEGEPIAVEGSVCCPAAAS